MKITNSRAGLIVFLISGVLISGDAFSSPKNPCEAVIAEVICEVAPPAKEQDRYKDGRTCLKSDTSRYQAQLKQAFSIYPEFIQNQFCFLKRIYIEQNFFGPAWSAPVDEQNPKELLIGLRKKDLDANINLQNYSSWFGQQSFGGAGNFQVNQKLPRVEIKPRLVAILPFLAFIFLHELGHTFDYQRHFNREKTDPKFSDSWTSLQWSDIGEIRPGFDFKNRKSICLNHCNGKYLDSKDASTLYRNLYSQGFVSQLSAVNAMEDFAESFAYYVMNRFLGADFTVQTDDGNSFPVGEFLQSPAFSRKLEYLKRAFDFKP